MIIGRHWQEKSGRGIFLPIPSYSSLFQPFQSVAIYSNQFQSIPQAPISNPQSPIWNAQLCILSPIGHLRVSSLVVEDGALSHKIDYVPIFGDFKS